jgi:hypothetical protein
VCAGAPSRLHDRYADVQIQLCEDEPDDGKPLTAKLLLATLGSFLVLLCTLVALHSVMDFFMLQACRRALCGI